MGNSELAHSSVDVCFKNELIGPVTQTGMDAGGCACVVFVSANINFDMRTEETPLSISGINRTQYTPVTRKRKINRFLERK